MRENIWSDADDRRNIIFRADGSADNTTGYVLGLHLNFDPLMDPDLIERDAIASGDYEVKPAYRRYARLSGVITATLPKRLEPRGWGPT
jgi:hypothetical protein